MTCLVAKSTCPRQLDSTFLKPSTVRGRLKVRVGVWGRGDFEQKTWVHVFQIYKILWQKRITTKGTTHAWRLIVKQLLSGGRRSAEKKLKNNNHKKIGSSWGENEEGKHFSGQSAERILNTSGAGSVRARAQGGSPTPDVKFNPQNLASPYLAAPGSLRMEYNKRSTYYM